MLNVFNLCLRLFLVIAVFVVIIAVPFAHAQIEIQDSHGKYRFEKPPERVVVLNWALGEQMLELGETPVGFADIEGYQSHTSIMSIPEGVVDVGERLSPKLNKIRALKPDVILIGYSQRSLLRPLSNIATVIYFKNFGKRYNNHEKSVDRFWEMAKLFDKTQLAEVKLAQRDERFSQLREELHTAYKAKSLPLPTVQFIVPEALDASKRSSVLLFGENSMPFYAAQELGLSVLAAQKNDQFGMARLSKKEYSKLSEVQSGTLCKFYFSSYAVEGSTNAVEGSTNNAVEDSNSYVEDSIDYVEDSTDNGLSSKRVCSQDLSYQNGFGGVMSVLYLAESISQALLATMADKPAN